MVIVSTSPIWSLLVAPSSPGGSKAFSNIRTPGSINSWTILLNKGSALIESVSNYSLVIWATSCGIISNPLGDWQTYSNDQIAPYQFWKTISKGVLMCSTLRTRRLPSLMAFTFLSPWAGSGFPAMFGPAGGTIRNLNWSLSMRSWILCVNRLWKKERFSQLNPLWGRFFCSISLWIHSFSAALSPRVTVTRLSAVSPL